MSPTRVAALRAMAHADESPHEADIARTKLAEAGVPVDPPRPPAPPAAPAPMPSWQFRWGVSVTATNTVFTTTITVNW